jgi:hypothetical protein
MGIFEGIIFAITVLTAVVKIVDVIVDRFFPESKVASVVDIAGELLDTADDVTDILTDGKVDTIGEENSVEDIVEA